MRHKKMSWNCFGLRTLRVLALCAAFIGANSLCIFCYHNPEKPEALNRLKKI